MADTIQQKRFIIVLFVEEVWKESRCKMTKGEYCKSKGLLVYGKDLNEEADAGFKRMVDMLVDCFEKIYFEDEDSEV